MRWTMRLSALTLGTLLFAGGCAGSQPLPPHREAVPAASPPVLGDSEARDLMVLDGALTRHAEVDQTPLHVRMSVTPISGTLVNSLVEETLRAGVKTKLVLQRSCFDVFLSARSESGERVPEGQLSSYVMSADLGGPAVELDTVSSSATHPEAALLRERLAQTLKSGHGDRSRNISGPGRFMREFLCAPPGDLTRLRAFHATLRARPSVKFDFLWNP